MAWYHMLTFCVLAILFALFVLGVYVSDYQEQMGRRARRGVSKNVVIWRDAVPASFLCVLGLVIYCLGSIDATDNDLKSTGIMVMFGGSLGLVVWLCANARALARKSHAARRKNSADADSINPGCDSCADCNGKDCARPGGNQRR